MRNIFITSYLLSFLVLTACKNDLNKSNIVAKDESPAVEVNHNKQANSTKISISEYQDTIEATTSSLDSTVDEYADDLYYIPDGTVTGIFEDATVYAASTDFNFTINGTPKLIRVDNEEYFELATGNDIAGYDIPADLIDPSDDLEGVPGGNPKYIGKKFEITINDDLLKIKLLK